MLTKNKLLIIWLFGVISGFTIMVSGNTLNYWLVKEQIDLKTIGIFAAISLPYSINFLWAPIFDTRKVVILNRLFGPRLSWLCLIQSLLAVFILILAGMSPKENLFFFGLTGLIISFLSSAQDTILGALRTEIIAKESQGTASGIYIFGYRTGMLISGSGAIYLSAFIGWGEIYKILALLTFLSLLVLLSNNKFLSECADIQENQNALKLQRSGREKRQKFRPNEFKEQKEPNYFVSRLVQDIISILKPIGPLREVILILLFLVLYRLADNFINVMINAFLIHLNYSELEVASVGKSFGILGAIIGGLIASFIMKKKSILDSLLIFGVLHALAHSLFIIQNMYGKDLKLLFVVIGFESITGGMSMAAYIAFIASLCAGKFRATQYSFFSSMMGLSRSVFPAISGYIVVELGWQSFFLFTSIIAVPSLFLIYKLAPLIKNNRQIQI